ncbi:MAG: polysaccharide deacetylase family protein, partial [Ignavibacteriaceae bacterium]|nr:polysaccharide deacetylase family protein [Ignavibacteriaceae bacterium]
MKKFESFYNPPLVIKKMFGSFVWESKCSKILLTFDDGPIPETTPLILKKLDEKKLKALFFTVGENAEKYRSLCKEILSEGHVIGNH